MNLTALRSLFRLSPPKVSTAALIIEGNGSCHWFSGEDRRDRRGFQPTTLPEAALELKKLSKAVRVVLCGRDTFCSIVPVVDGELKLSSYLPYDESACQIRRCPIDGDPPTGEFVAAATKSAVGEVKAALESAGLVVEAVEVPATVLIRKAQRLNAKQVGGLLQIHIGARFTQVLLTLDGSPKLVRESEVGRKDLQYHLQMSQEPAETTLESLSVLGSSPVEPVVVEILEQVARTIAGSAHLIDRLSVFGPGNLRGFGSRLSEHLGLKEGMAADADHKNALFEELVRA